MKSTDLNETISLIEKASNEFSRHIEGEDLPVLRMNTRILSLLVALVNLREKLQKKERK
ncbi:MAG: hypothetical protein OEY66_07335 [Gammaproteobacteria bacterium]|nr:hypothetical protein [Gammaproteobacteria bacterium]